MATRGATWTLPTTYVNGEAISAEDQAKIITHIYMDGTEVGVSTPGASSWEGEIDMVQGQTYVFAAKSEINGQFSVATPEVSFTVPFFPPNPPTDLVIS
jgi:hypothetical protein